MNREIMMKMNRKQIIHELVLEGARTRLLHLNIERKLLLNILGLPEIDDDQKRHTILKSIENKPQSNRKRNYKGKHWMQLPENKQRVAAMVKKAHRARRKNQKLRAQGLL